MIKNWIIVIYTELSHILYLKLHKKLFLPPDFGLKIIIWGPEMTQISIKIFSRISPAHPKWPKPKKIQNSWPRSCFCQNRYFLLFFNTFLYKMMQYQTNRFPHLFHKVLGADFLHTTFYWPSRHRVKICKGAYFATLNYSF